jgi:hypothetical protein
MTEQTTKSLKMKCQWICSKLILYEEIHRELYHPPLQCYGNHIEILAYRSVHQITVVSIHFVVNSNIIQYKYCDYTNTSQIKLTYLCCVVFPFTFILLLSLLYLKKKYGVKMSRPSLPPNPRQAVVLSCILYETLEMNVLERKFISV